jgi:hypothetical protein
MLTKDKLYSRNDLESIGFEDCKEKEVNDLIASLESTVLTAATFKGKHYLFSSVGLEMLQYKFDYEALKNLVNSVINYTQIPFKYFEWNSLLMLNVSISEDGFQEFAVFKKDDLSQKYYKFESYTVSWITEERLSVLLVEADNQLIHQIKGMNESVPLREWRGKPSHVFTFEQFETFKKEYSKFVSTY